jgi:hypothetical protein
MELDVSLPGLTSLGLAEAELETIRRRSGKEGMNGLVVFVLYIFRTFGMVLDDLVMSLPWARFIDLN